jgi:hypothetical protein
MKYIIEINIGLETSKNYGTPAQLRVVPIKQKLRSLFEGKGRVAQSNTEKTLVWTGIVWGEAGLEILESFFYTYARELKQDCIAYRTIDESGNESGHLVGRHAEDWGGKFAIEHFITPESINL